MAVAGDALISHEKKKQTRFYGWTGSTNGEDLRSNGRKVGKNTGRDDWKRKAFRVDIET